MRAAVIALFIIAASAANGQVQYSKTLLTGSMFPFSADYNFQSFTLNAIIKITGPVSIYDRIISRETGYSAQYSFIVAMTENGTFAIFSYGNPGGAFQLTSTNSIDDGIDHFISVTYNYENGVFAIYVDGMIDVAATSPGFIPVSIYSPWVAIGRIAQLEVVDAPINARITDARVYSRALSASEIRQIYETPWALADDPSLVLRTCVESGETGSTLSGVARNYGTGADGVYSNSPTVAPGKIQTSKPMEDY